MKTRIFGASFMIALMLAFGNNAFTQNPEPPPPGDEIAGQKAKDAAAAKKAAENEKANKKAIDEIDKKLKNLDELKDADKIKALKAMKKYLEDHLTEDPATALENAAKAAKKAVATGDKIKDAESESMVDKLRSDLSKEIFGLVVEARGTGQTTGHIANLSVTNNGDVPLDVIPQIFFIPSEGQYQSYVGRIPEGITVPPKGTVSIPVNGYCADVTNPPIPAGTSLPPLDTWVPVLDPSLPSEIPHPTTPAGGSKPPMEGIPFFVIDSDPVKPFTPSSVPGITTSPGFKPQPTSSTDITTTWPGTDIPVGGTFIPGTKPEIIAPVLVGALVLIEYATEAIQRDGQFPTPFSPDPVREREAIIQQTFWIYTAALEGKKYEKEDFSDNVYDQFENSTGKTVAALPPEQKKEVDNGITDFWNTFQATGVQAKVLAVSKPEGMTTAPIDPHQTIADPGDPPVLIKDEKTQKQCECGNISFDLLVWNTEVVPPNGWRGVQENKYQSKVDVGSKAGLPDHEIKAGKKGLKKGSAQIVELKNIEFGCSCVEITEAISDAIAALAKLEKSNRTKLDRAKSDLVKKEADLKAAKEKLRPVKATIDRLTREVDDLIAKVKELETPITEKQNEIEQLKKDATVSDCPAYESADKRIPFPSVKVTSDGKNVDGKWGDAPNVWDYKFTVIKGDAALECKIVISFYCQGEECKEVQCSRTIVIKIDE
ncbi:MAG TPA: hypothetical protein VI603_04895 [Saprospiraceae bacterium]|nr:hypothetical protein [Saprospiraceae bacterium]